MRDIVDDLELAWPGCTQFVVLTRADWERIRAAVPADDREAFHDIEILPLTITTITDEGDS